MKIPWILYVSMVATAAPLVTGLLFRRLTPARRWVLIWSLTVLVGNVLSLITSRLSINNHALRYVGTPLSAGIALWVFSYWQLSGVARLSMRLLIPLLGIVWIAIVVLIENLQTFSLLAEPFAGLLVLGAAIYTLVARAFHDKGKWFDQDWLWVAAGMTFYSAAAIALPPTAHWLLTRNRDLVAKAYQVKAVLEIVAVLALARGLACPIPEWKSGGSFSRASSRSPSSSPASSSPS